MFNRKKLATEAAARALRLRKKLNVPLEGSVSAIDAAETIGIEVRFVGLPSMEGIYVAGTEPKILLSSLRPQGRRGFTCGHEIGHHVFGHGEQFDEMTEEKSALRRDDPQEFIADCFSAYFLMPKATIDIAMRRRNYTYELLDPFQTATLASWLGVGYDTLINHLLYGLDIISKTKARQLQSITPRNIRNESLGIATSTHLHIADQHWFDRTIDCEVGDHILLPGGTTSEGGKLAAIDLLKNNTVFVADQPGIARVINNQMKWTCFVRVSRKEYIGRSCYRFEEEVN